MEKLTPEGNITITTLMHGEQKIGTVVGFSEWKDFATFYSKGDLGEIVEKDFDEKYRELYDEHLDKYFVQLVNFGSKGKRFHTQFDIYEKSYTPNWNFSIMPFKSINVQIPISGSRHVSEFFSRIDKAFVDYLEEKKENSKKYFYQILALGSRTEDDFRVQVNFHKVLRREKDRILLKKHDDYEKISIYRLENLTIPEYFLRFSKQFNQAIKSSQTIF